jgi:sulfite reductase alpha subunit-like flavoprotein
LLTRLDLPFSRDQHDKIYVQHRLLEHAAELWTWFEDGAHLYVCGDGQRMARDVDAGLAYIIAREGRMDAAAAKAYLARLAETLPKRRLLNLRNGCSSRPSINLPRQRSARPRSCGARR